MAHKSGLTTSLVGFDHVFVTAQRVQFAPGLTLKVIPPSALILLKIVAFIEDQQWRAKHTMSGNPTHKNVQF